ncbi:MAG: hypothetical protein IPO27_02780 [Bacteroidetes bacterium]|nr:hypothetical protein [Bacteroidota bacterium]
MIIADDRGGAPLLLYVGEKGTVAQNYPVNLSFLKNNGLANGQLYVWCLTTLQ